MPVSYVLASGEGALDLGADVTWLAVEWRIVSSSPLVQPRSAAFPARLMHAGWFAAECTNGQRPSRTVVWHKYVEFEHEKPVLPSAAIVARFAAFAIPAGTTLDLWVVT